MPDIAEVKPKTEEEIRAELEKDYKDRFEVWKTKELADLADRQQQLIKDELKKEVNKWRDEQKPLTIEEIQKMVDQEYVDITVNIMVDAENYDEPQRKTFTVRELPQEIERKFYRKLKERLKDKAPQIAAIQQKSMDKTFEDVLAEILETVDGAFDVMSDAVAIIVNPFDKDKEITGEWVAKHISSNRQLSIILAQVEVNKLRDFFSLVFRGGQKAGTTKTPLSFQSLLGLAR